MKTEKQIKRAIKQQGKEELQWHRKYMKTKDVALSRFYKIKKERCIAKTMALEWVLK